MAEEEKQEKAVDEEAKQEEAAEDAAPSGDGQPPEEADEAQEEAPESDGDVEEPVAEEAADASAEETAAPAESEPEEALTPKQLRKRERSRASGPPGPPRSDEQRAAERSERRRASAEGRRRYRATSRRKRGEPRAGTPPASREPGPKKVRQGTVVSAGGDKTITVQIAVVRRHPTYEKVVRRTNNLRAHDESNEARKGDVVRVVESRPLSRTKRWRLLDVLERAPR